jgi:DNA repair exonuclease SbcCD ATPase subunit
MKLLHVAVEGCGRFGTPARIEGFGPGVNILSAGNEAGKSTLFRAIRTCLFERHSGTSKEITALATEGLSLPVAITVGFEHDGRTYEISKSFLKSRSASLSCDGVVTARNAEADEKVWEILGIAQKSARALDEAAYGVLWVQQGQSVQVPEPSEGATSVLNDVIAQEVGTLVGGERARTLLSEVRDELSKLITDTRKPRANGPLDIAQKECERIAGELQDVEHRLRELNERYTALDQHRAEHRRVNDPAAAEQMARELAEAQQKLDAAEKAAQALLRLEAEERHAHERLSSQRDRLDALRKRAMAIDENRARLAEVTAALHPLAEQEAEARNALGTAMSEKSALDLALEGVDARERALQQFTALAARLSKRESMAVRRSLLEDFRTRLAANEAALRAATVTDAVIKALDGLEQEEDTLRARIDAAAARLTIEAGSGSAVAVNGTAVEGHAARAVSEALTITVGTGVTITVSPPAATLAAAEAKLKDQRGRLAALLGEHMAASPAALRQLRAARMRSEDEARDLKAERAALSIPETPAAEIAMLEAAIGEIDAELQQALAAHTGLPDAAAIDAEQQAVSARRGELRAARSRIEAVIAGQNATLERIAKARGTLDGQLREITSKLETDLALLPDDTRHRLIADAEAERDTREAAHRGKAALLEERRGEAPATEDIERLAARQARLASALQNRAAKIEDLNQKIARLEGEIQTAGGDGLGERAATLALQQKLALAEQDRQRERVEVLSLLRNTVDQCYNRRREELNAPLRRHLKPFINDVFPQADVQLGENFAVSGLNRMGPGSELFGRLSLGTQEQVAVLVRLAMGAMIAEKGADVPIILDDALVFSDDERIEQMFDAINRAGRRQQVIVLTCRARSFASLGGRQLQILHDDMK